MAVRSDRRASVAYGNGAAASLYTYHDDDALMTLGHDMAGSADDVGWTFLSDGGLPPVGLLQSPGLAASPLGFNAVNQLTSKMFGNIGPMAYEKLAA